jgi:hypothetical protein
MADEMGFGIGDILWKSALAGIPLATEVMAATGLLSSEEYSAAKVGGIFAGLGG